MLVEIVDKKDIKSLPKEQSSFKRSTETQFREL